jgi:N-methylhydantoinase A
MREIPQNGQDVSLALKEPRPAYFAEVGGFVDCSIYDRYKLEPGHEIQGPAIVEEVDSTTVIHPGYRAVADKFGNLFLQR